MAELKNQDLLSKLSLEEKVGICSGKDFWNLKAVPQLDIPEIMVTAKIAPSRGEARRLIEGGGVSINDTKVTTAGLTLIDEVIAAGEFVIHKGKKVHVKIKLI